MRKIHEENMKRVSQLSEGERAQAIQDLHLVLDPQMIQVILNTCHGQHTRIFCILVPSTYVHTSTPTHTYLPSYTTPAEILVQYTLWVGYKSFHSFTILVVLKRPLCNTMQDAATHFKTWRRTATHCDALQHTTTQNNALHCTATHCNTLQHTPPQHAPLAAVEAASIVTQCNPVQDSATHCNTLQHTATHTTLIHTTCSCWSSVHSNTLQHAARHCNTLQHTQL